MELILWQAFLWINNMQELVLIGKYYASNASYELLYLVILVSDPLILIKHI